MAANVSRERPRVKFRLGGDTHARRADERERERDEAALASLAPESRGKYLAGLTRCVKEKIGLGLCALVRVYASWILCVCVFVYVYVYVCMCGYAYVFDFLSVYVSASVLCPCP